MIEAKHKIGDIVKQGIITKVIVKETHVRYCLKRRMGRGYLGNCCLNENEITPIEKAI